MASRNAGNGQSSQTEMVNQFGVEKPPALLNSQPKKGQLYIFYGARVSKRGPPTKTTICTVCRGKAYACIPFFLRASSPRAANKMEGKQKVRTIKNDQNRRLWRQESIQPTLKKLVNPRSEMGNLPRCPPLCLRAAPLPPCHAKNGRESGEALAIERGILPLALQFACGPALPLPAAQKMGGKGGRR